MEEEQKWREMVKKCECYADIVFIRLLLKYVPEYTELEKDGE